MKKSAHLFVLLLLIIFSCTENKEDNSLESKDNFESKTLRISDTLVFRSDLTHSANSNFFSVVGNTLYQQNNLDNSIYSFDIKTEKKQFKLSVPEYGPKKVGKIQGFLFENTDSIYVINPPHNTIKLIDSALNIRDIYQLNTDKSKIAAISQMPLLKFDSLFFISCLPDSDYFNDPRFIVHNINQKQIVDELILSDFIANEDYGLLFALNSMAKLGNNKVVISIGVNKHVFIYDLLTRKITDKINIGSEKFDKTEPLNKSQNLSTKERLERNYYIAIYTIDLDGKTFLLRTTSLAIEPYDAAGNLKTLYDKGQSVIIYDLSNNKKVGEYYLPNDLYDFRTGFQFDNRLYFLLNNPNSENNEDLMKFVGYEIYSDDSK